jgi:pimeloyl-ACP methyl ester carboxylesterase
VKKSSLVKLALAAGAAGATGAVVAAGRRWAANDDPDAETRLVVPDGDDVRVPTSDGGEIAGTAVGDGRTFVLVHGWTNDRRIWAPVARLLVERGHRVVLYDQRGHGASRAGSDGLTIETLGRDMAAVLEHLDIRDAIVAGHSMGGMAAQTFAIEHPDVLSERVAAVALVSTASSELGMPGPIGLLAPLVLGSSLTSKLVSNSRLGPFLVRGTMGRKATRTNLRVMQDTFAATEPSARAAFYRAIAAMDLSEGLADVDVPVLVISGARDGLVAHANARRLVDVIDGARFEAVPDAGHMLPLENPDLLADLLERLAEESSEHDRSLSAAAR